MNHKDNTNQKDGKPMGGHGERFKTRPSIADAKPMVEDFFKSQRIMHVAVANETSFPVLDTVDYYFVGGKHIAIAPPMTKVASLLEDGAEFSAFIQEGIAKGAKRFYADMKCHLVPKRDRIVLELLKVNPMVEKMLMHGGKILQLETSNAILSFGPQEVYSVDNNLDVTFAKFTPNGKERFEHSRQVLMQYLDRNVIFNVICENGVYECLAKADSRKIEHITAGGKCMIFDGKDNHFETVITMHPEKTDEVFEKLQNTNNSFFKEDSGLVALTFKKLD